jgi:clan AA aspartic protease
MKGEVTADYEISISLEVIGPSGTAIHINAILDTGFSSFLSLPTSLVNQLGLQHLHERPFILAGGHIVDFDVYLARVRWNGMIREITVVCAEDAVLLGMQMIRGHRMEAAIVDGGPVHIEPI